MIEKLESCEICPKKCRVNRIDGEVGVCQAKEKVKIALYSLHQFEEPCISGYHGSGTVFFSHCNLKCCYCQNYEISQQGKGREITIEELAEIFLKLQEKKAENINLVTPTSYTIQIIQAIELAREKGMYLPIIYNTNGYETMETLKLLEGYIDIYLPDLKYYDNDLGKQYSKVENYFEIASQAIKEMVRQVGFPVLNKNGMIKKGVLIRHLLLPNHIENSKKVLSWLIDTFGKEVYLSIMAQYFPTYQAKQVEKLKRKLTKREYDEIERHINQIGVHYGYIQELGEHEEEYVPNWEQEEEKK